MSSPASIHTPSSPFTPRPRHLSNPPATNYATPTRHSPFPQHVSSSSIPLSQTTLAPTNPADEFGLDDNDDDLISTVGGGVYIDEDVDMDKEGHSDGEQDEDTTGFSELDADMTVFANLGNNEGGTVAGAQQDLLPSSSQLSGGGVSVSAGIIEEDDDDDNDTGTEIMERKTGMSPVQHFATLGNGEAANASPSAIMLPIRPYQRPQTPTRSPIASSPTPRAPSSMARHSRASSRSSVFSMISPSSPSRHAANSSIRPLQERDQTTQLLLDDFTVQFNAVNQLPQQPQTPNHHNHHVHSSRGSISGIFSPQPLNSRSETTGTPIRRSTAGTPDNNNRFLIDFDIPPPPTPRSIPSITLREAEKLKSEFLSQLGELKAQLSGRDAEVLNLRESLREAESRCGDLREEVETLEQAKADGERILAQFREQAQAQFEDARREWDEEREKAVKDANQAREKFESEIEMVRVQFGELEKISNEAKEKEEKMRQELEATKKEMEIVRSNTPAPAYTPRDPNASRPALCANCANGGGGASKEEVDRIAKELHVLYKQKHETKVAALKKSYEQRWEKKMKALESEIETLKETFPQTQPAKSTVPAAELKELNSKTQTLIQELEDVKVENENLKDENKQLKEQVQKERREKGELVGAVEEMLALQMQTLSEAVTAAEEERHEGTSIQKTNPRPQPQAAPSAGAAPSKSSGLAKPGTLKVKDVKKLEKGWEGVRRRASGIGITPLGETGGVTGIAAPRAGASGLVAPRAGGASALKGGIERMGRGAGPTKG
ncbi:hypothetical protein EV426DRAFT_399748 [Tirmania nivea]|nr:hypothetical protein EV426DRAFT_399748 [Tirmania nivea]